MVTDEKGSDFSLIYELDLKGVDNFNFQWKNKEIRHIRNCLQPDRKFDLACKAPKRPLPASKELA